jgi:hypothetical protein
MRNATVQQCQKATYGGKTTVDAVPKTTRLQAMRLTMPALEAMDG